MSPNSAVLLNAQQGLPKPISARAHGIIDYSHAAFFLTMALVCRKKNPAAARAAAFTGSLVLAQSLLTDYPLGWKRVLPFATHGKLDAGFAAFSSLIPGMFGFSGTKMSALFKGNTLVEATVVALTDFDSEHARQG